ncbi:MAG: hypothetical protein ACXW4L_03995 [Candidatus Limnocylindrales bacterium]
MLPALILALLAVCGGTIASYWYDDEASLPVRVAYGAVTGYLALALLGFIAANLVGLRAATVIAGIGVVLPLLSLSAPGIRARLREDGRAMLRGLEDALRAPSLSTIGPVAFAAAMTGLLAVVFGKVVIESGGSISTGYVNNLGDLPFHFQVTMSFADGANFPPEDPTYAGTGFAYPYMADFLGAMFVGLGASLADAYLIENLALGLALVAILYRFTVVLTSDRLAAAIAPILVLFSGGLGFVLLLGDVGGSERGLFDVLTALPRDYTITGEGPYRWGNAITTLLVTQRSLLFGLPVALIVFTLLWRLVHEASGPAMRTAIAAGILTGALPLVHAHSFVVVMGTAFFVGLFFRQWQDGKTRPWAVYVLIALAIALPQIWWSTKDSIADAGTFFGFEFGWDRRDENPIWFWFLNTGLFIPLAILGAVWPARGDRPRLVSRTLLLFAAAFLVWFIVPNVAKLAPWVWDNIKVLFYAFVGFVPIVALVVARLLRGPPVWAAAGVTALLVLTLAGGLDVWRVVSGQTSYREFDADGIAIAAVIRAETPPRALVLHAPTYDPPVFLTGRRSLLGYTGYIWAHGLEYADREADILRIYAGEPDTDALIDRYGIDYIVVSPIEHAYMPVDDAAFERFTLVDQVGEYRLYDVSRP